MAQITFRGNPITTEGALPQVGSQAPAFSLVDENLEHININDIQGKKILNIVPSLDTRVCALSAKKFKETLPSDITLITISRDTPFVFNRYIKEHYGGNKDSNILLGSDISHDFGKSYQCVLSSGPLSHLLSRAVVVLDEQNKVLYTEQVQETTDEPNYEAALQSLQ